MKEDRAIGKKTKNPGTSRGVHAKRGQRGNHDLRLNVVEETRKIEKQYTANTISGNTVPCFETKESSSIGSGEEFAGTKLSWAQEVVTKVEGAETGSNDFLE